MCRKRGHVELKRILITGKNSYIGEAVEKYLSTWPEKYNIDTIDLRDELWKNSDFSHYDVVFHVAGIAHQDNGRIDKDRYKKYFSINRDLALDVIKKAYSSGVTHFIYMSSMSVYGASARVNQQKVIDINSVPKPVNAYGESKLQADYEILKMNSKDFVTTVLRPPMVYGPGCKGNYVTLSKAARKLSLFPDIKNQRSMIFVGNLSAYVKEAIDKRLSGVLFPQNNEYVCTSALVKEIANTNGKSIRLTSLFNPIIWFLSGKLGVIDKVFGNLTYERDGALGDCTLPYSFSESIILTEKGKDI